MTAPSDLNNAPNGGFNYAKSSNQTIEFYKFWYKSRQLYPRKHDQDVLNKIKYKPFLREIGSEIKFLDTAYFGGFCQPSKDLNLVCTMHANSNNLASRLEKLSVFARKCEKNPASFMVCSTKLRVTSLIFSDKNLTICTRTRNWVLFFLLSLFTTF